MFSSKTIETVAGSAVACKRLLCVFERAPGSPAFVGVGLLTTAYGWKDKKGRTQESDAIFEKPQSSGLRRLTLCSSRCGWSPLRSINQAGAERRFIHISRFLIALYRPEKSLSCGSFPDRLMGFPAGSVSFPA
jgi:hypothetical protein